MMLIRHKLNADTEKGQAIVESAIVLPMYVFLILGILQLSLMHQAQLLTKYAAYRAARTGALHNADTVSMDYTAAQVVLPKFASDPMFIGSGPQLRPTRDAAQWSLRYAEVAGLYGTVGLDLPPTTVTICGPLRQHFSGGGPDIDFDDHDLLGGASVSWQDYSRTKLRVQVQFNYRMPIPFANDVIARIYLGQEISRTLRMGESDSDRMPTIDPGDWNFIARLLAALQNREYVVPIRAAYSMRMMSNIHLDNLPDKNECVLKFDPQVGRDYWGL